MFAAVRHQFKQFELLNFLMLCKIDNFESIAIFNQPICKYSSTC